MVINDYIFRKQKYIFGSLILAIESTFEMDIFSKAELSKTDQL